jgi:Predicted hydrolases or acyltransferases (alpha/beta hydrolase superfamily)
MQDLFDLPLCRYAGDGVEIAYRTAGEGPPLLLLHGHPQSHAMWHKVWPALVRSRTLVAADLRGYGDSSKPPASPGHEAHSKRAMAADMVALMRSLGHERFDVLAHDRGARVAHRLALDHAGRVGRMMLLDIAPTLDMYEGTNRAFAQAYFHWFWLIQPAPMPERMIESDPACYVRSIMGSRRGGLAWFAPQALAEYERCAQAPGWTVGICEDYRASATIDLEHDRADREAGRVVQCPLRVLWGEHGAVGKNFDVLALWGKVARDVDGRVLPSGHYIAEEAPELLIEEARAFFGMR